MDNVAGVETQIVNVPCDDDERPQADAKDGDTDAGVSHRLKATNGASVIQYDKPLKRHRWSRKSQFTDDNSSSSPRRKDPDDKSDAEKHDIT